jgi:hypothetical protein
MEEKRRLPSTLMGGTTAMRGAGKMYLPQEPSETAKAYAIRLQRSFLFNGYRKTVHDMAGKVFSKAIVVADDMPEELALYAENIDLAGRNIDTFGFGVFLDALSNGVTYLLVDMDKPVLRADGTIATLTLAQSRQQNRRPWVVHVQAQQVLGWRSGVIAGVETLTQFRFKETVREQTDEYGEKAISQVRVLRREGDTISWEVHRESPEVPGMWAKIDEGPLTIDEIPVIPVYFNRTGFMMGEPPLSDLAEVNLSHWQSQSDQRNILHVARVPILFGAGFDAKTGKLEVGAQRMLTSSDPNAKLAYVEHSGAAIESGRNDLKDLEFQMQVMGLELLIPKPGGQSATGEIIDATKMNTPLAMMAMALKDALEQMFVLMAKFVGKADFAGSLTINTDFGVSLRGAQDTQDLLKMVKEGIISRTTFIDEMKRRAVLSEDVNAEEEAERALNEMTPPEDDEEPEIPDNIVRLPSNPQG